MRGAAEDEELMRAVAAGDAAAVEILFERYHRDLYRFFRRFRGPGDAPEDLVQDVFLRILKYAGAFRPGGSFRGWLYRIARNAVSDARRTGARLVAVEEPAAMQDRTDDHQDLERLSAALARLSEADREVVVLSRFVGLSGDELAAALECSSGAARVRLHRALTRLRAICVEGQKGVGHAMRRVD